MTNPNEIKPVNVKGYKLIFINSPGLGIQHMTFCTNPKSPEDIQSDLDIWHSPEMQYEIELIFGVVIEDTHVWISTDLDNGFQSLPIVVVDYTILDSNSYLKWLMHDTTDIIPIAYNEEIEFGNYDGSRYMFSINMLKNKQCSNNFFYNHKFNCEVSFIYAPDIMNYTLELENSIIPKLIETVKRAVIPEIYRDQMVIKYHNSHGCIGSGSHIITIYFDGLFTPADNENPKTQYLIRDITKDFISYDGNILKTRVLNGVFNMLVTTTLMHDDILPVLNISNNCIEERISNSITSSNIHRIKPKFINYRLVGSHDTTSHQDCITYRLTTSEIITYGNVSGLVELYDLDRHDNMNFLNSAHPKTFIIKISTDLLIKFIDTSAIAIPEGVPDIFQYVTQSLECGVSIASDINYTYLGS